MRKPSQRCSDARLNPSLVLSSQRQKVQWLKYTNRAKTLISSPHWFTVWPSPPPFKQIMYFLSLFFFYHMVRKVLFPCFSISYKWWEPITICEMLWIHIIWAQLRKRMVIIHSFHFPAHLKQFSVPQLKRSHPNVISSNPCSQHANIIVQMCKTDQTTPRAFCQYVGC